MSKVSIGLDKSGSYRVYLTDTTELVQTAQDIHMTSPLATAGLGRVLTAAAIMSLQLKKEDDRLTIIFRGDGPARQIVAAATGDGSVKGYISNPDVDLPLRDGTHLDVGGSLFPGTLTVIRDMGLKEPYSGTVDLVSGEVAEDLTAYYYISEQQNTSFALGVKLGTDGRVAASGGMFIQIMPDAEEAAIDALEEMLKTMAPITTVVETARREAAQGPCQAGDSGDAPENGAAIGSGPADEEAVLVLMRKQIFGGVDPAYQPETLEVRPVRWYCGCSRERMAEALAAIGREELTRLADEDHGAELSCHFCESRYHFSEQDLREIIAGLSGSAEDLRG